MGTNLPFIDLGTGKTATQVAAGHLHTCAILNDGLIKCWGKGEQGVLGYGDTESRGDGPNEMGDNLGTVDLGKTAKQVSPGYLHTCAILDDGTVKCWGYGNVGQLGYGATDSRGDASNEMGSSLGTVDLGSGKTAKQLVSGNNHNCVILNDDDTVKCWGWAHYGQLGYGDKNNSGDAAGEMGNSLGTVNIGTVKSAKQLAAGDSHTCAL